MNHKYGNILVIMADQLSALALGCYHHPQVISPNIDRLAADGVIFDAAYSSSPLCTPARYAFMTGQYVSRCGGYDNAAYLSATTPTFAHYLRRMGYRTCLAGKMHFVGPDQLHGFEERLTTDVYPADFGWVPDWRHPDERIDLWYHNMSSVKQAGVAAITNQLSYDDEVGYQAVKAIYDHARGGDQRPLCLVASFIHPHDPYAARKHYWDQYNGMDIGLPSVPRDAVDDPHCKRLEKVIALDAVTIDDDDIRRARRAYFANVTYIDDWVGRLRQTLNECGLADDTTIVFTSDHGDMLGERGLWYKMSFLEWSCRIPLIIWNRNRFDGKRVSQPASHVDLLPTLIDIAAEHSRHPKPEAIDPLNGRSLIPLCDDNGAEASSYTISEYLAEGTAEPMLMIRDRRFKFIRCAGDPDLLFDLDDDADELVNLAAQESHAARMQKFDALATRHWDPAAIKACVLADQNRRRQVHEALSIGAREHWDYNPPRDASKEYTRSHHDLTEFDFGSRFPRPRGNSPSWK